MFRNLERILVAVDDDTASEAAVEHAVALAASERAKVTFVHVTSILGQDFVPNGNKVNRVPDRSHMPLLGSAMDVAGEAGIDAQVELLVGFPPEQIAALAEELDSDLIVVGSRHMQGAKRLLHGSVSRALLDATRRPLMVVTEPAVEPARV